jgi:hypothetical protein
MKSRDEMSILHRLGVGVFYFVKPKKKGRNPDDRLCNVLLTSLQSRHCTVDKCRPHAMSPKKSRLCMGATWHGDMAPWFFPYGTYVIIIINITINISSSPSSSHLL